MKNSTAPPFRFIENNVPVQRTEAAKSRDRQFGVIRMGQNAFWKTVIK